MSRLDDIQTTCDNCKYSPALSETCKERVKDLFLELVNETFLLPCKDADVLRSKILAL